MPHAPCPTPLAQVGRQAEYEAYCGTPQHYASPTTPQVARFQRPDSLGMTTRAVAAIIAGSAHWPTRMSARMLRSM